MTHRALVLLLMPTVEALQVMQWLVVPLVIL